MFLNHYGIIFSSLLQSFAKEQDVEGRRRKEKEV